MRANTENIAIKTFESIAAKAMANTGCDDVTILKFTSDLRFVWRAFSTMSGPFPKAGIKPVPSEDWIRKMKEKRPLLTTGVTQVKRVFPDHSVILQSGFTTVLNLPIVFEDVCIGTMNCLFRGYDKTSLNMEKIRNQCVYISSSNLPVALARLERPTELKT